MAGRIALINSTLTAIPCHFLCNAPVPISTLNKVNSLIRNFLWSGQQARNTIHYASWDDLCCAKDNGGIGIKNMLIWRKVMMAKVAAHVIGEDNSLMAKILKQKYSGANRFRPNRSQSKMWKIIGEGGQLAADNTFWMVGDGATISTLNDTWLSPMPIARWPTFVDINSLPDRVCSLLDGNYCWNEQNLDGFDRIANLHRECIGSKDLLIWSHTERTKMNAAAVYNSECKQSKYKEAWIWNAKVQPRFLLFAWRATNNLLPTYSWLLKHRLRDNAACPWGCGEEETISHMFATCTFIRMILRECSRLNLSFIQDLLINNFEPLNAECAINRRSFKVKCAMAIMYKTLKARNNMTHGQPFAQSAAIVIEAIMDASLGNWTVDSNLQSWWTSPPVGWIKINFDGAVRVNNFAGLGCIIRSSSGLVVAAKGVACRSHSVDMMELKSAWMGLELAMNWFNISSGIILEGDSAHVYKMLNNILNGIYSGSTESRLDMLLQKAPTVQISMVERSTNKAADYLAKNVCSDNFLWDGGAPLPARLLSIVSSDFSPM